MTNKISIYADIYNEVLLENDIVRYFRKHTLDIFSIGVIKLIDNIWYIETMQKELLSLNEYKTIKTNKKELLFKLMVKSEFFIDIENLVDITHKYITDYANNNFNDDNNYLEDIVKILLVEMYGANIIETLEVLKNYKDEE